MKNKLKQYFWNLLVNATQSLNTLTGGDPDQSFSGRTGIAFLLGKRWAKVVKPVIDFIFRVIKGDENHCITSIEWDRVEQKIINEIEYHKEA